MFEENRSSVDSASAGNPTLISGDFPAAEATEVTAIVSTVEERIELYDSTDVVQPDWVSFLFLLGQHLEQYRANGRCPRVVLVVPTVEFASLLIASGIIFQNTIETLHCAPSTSAKMFDELIGRPVRFPMMVKRKQRQLRGILDRIETINGVERLVIKYFDRPGDNSLTCQAYIKCEDFLLVVPDEEVANLSSRQRGQQLAENVFSLQEMIGRTGTAKLLSQKENLCWIIDTKNRLMDELEVPVPVKRLTQIEKSEQAVTLQLRDVVRPDLQRWPAVAETSRSHIDTGVPSSGTWASAIVVGTLPFLRFFETMESKIRIGIISATMSAYDEAISHAQKLFEQRAEHEILIPDDLLFAKPASFDIQIWETP